MNENIYEILANIEDLCSCGMEGCKQITIKRLEKELNLEEHWRVVGTDTCCRNGCEKCEQ